MLADLALFPRIHSWHVGAHVPSKPQTFMTYIGGVEIYRAVCDKVTANKYEGCEPYNW